MSASAEVIPFSTRRSQPTGKPLFSGEDEAMTSSLIDMLADEMTTWGRDGSARARIYFYLSFHYYSLQRWMGLLIAQETVDSRRLARQLDEAFRYITSTAALDGSIVDWEGHRMQLNELADHLRDLLRLIRTC